MSDELRHYRHAPCCLGALGYVDTFAESNCEDCKVLSAKMAALTGEDASIGGVAYYSEPERFNLDDLPKRAIFPKSVISALPGDMAGRLGMVRPDFKEEHSGYREVTGWTLDSQSFIAGTGMAEAFADLTDRSFIDPTELLGHIRVCLLRLYETGWKPSGR